eukprot:SAG11_NODE_119_length_15911_cov_7.077599_9_plen_132_part_00
MLTTQARHAWAATREELCAHGDGSNRALLEVIDTALFVVCLDDDVASNTDEISANLLHGTYKMSPQGVQVGTCCNRWYDKLQLIIGTDGSAGVNFEHSAVDGHTVLRFVSDVFADTIVRFASSVTGEHHAI